MPKRKHTQNLELFRKMSGKTVVTPPVLVTPSHGFWMSKTKEYYR